MKKFKIFLMPLLLVFVCFYSNAMYEIHSNTDLKVNMQKFPRDPRIPAIVYINDLTLSSEERELLEKHRPVGVLLSGKNCESEQQVIDLTKQLHDLGLYVAIDIEGKIVNRLRKFFPLQYNAADFRDTPLNEIYDYYFKIARYARDLGIDTIFAPVGDCCNDPNSFLHKRCFQGDVKRIAECITTVVKAFHEAGILAVAKHVPGHGKAIDSHFNLPTVDASKEDLYSYDFEIFRLAREWLSTESKPLSAAMVAHVTYSDIDPTSPATFSKIIMHDTVRDRIGLGDDIIISDAMQMKAVLEFFKRQGWATEENYKLVALQKFLEAGGDIAIIELLSFFASNPDAQIEKDPNIMPRLGTIFASLRSDKKL